MFVFSVCVQIAACVCSSWNIQLFGLRGLLDRRLQFADLARRVAIVPSIEISYRCCSRWFTPCDRMIRAIMTRKVLVIESCLLSRCDSSSAFDRERALYRSERITIYDSLFTEWHSVSLRAPVERRFLLLRNSSGDFSSRIFESFLENLWVSRASPLTSKICSQTLSPLSQC